MSPSVIINDFPRKTRGTFRIKADDNSNEAQKLEFAKKIIKELAIDCGITILLDCKMQGTGWVIIWWPSNEPKHQETDQIIN